MTRRLYLISTWCARHAGWVLAAWIVALLVISGLNNRLPAPGQQEINLENADSATAQTLLNRAFPGASSDAQPLVIACAYDLSSTKGKDMLKTQEDKLGKLEGVVHVAGPAQNDQLLSDDKLTAMVQVTVNSAYLGQTSLAQDILDTGIENAPGCQVALGGLMGQQLSAPDTKSSEVIGLLAAVIVLLLTLRRGWPVAVPLINAIITVGLGTAIVGILGRLVFIPDVAPTLGTMLGLGVGIDYALFLVIRHRGLLRRGFDINDSIGRTSGTAGAGMVFAGTTLIMAVCGLALTGISFLAWLGFAAAIFVALALCTSLSLVPALFALMKMRVLPKKDTKAHHTTDEHLDEGFWARIANAVSAKPWPYAIVATLFLLTLALPMTRMEFGQTDASALPPTTTAYQANELIVEAFGPGSTGPLAIVTQMNRIAAPPKNATVPSGTDPRTLDPRLKSLQATLKSTPGIYEVGDPVVSPDGGVAVLRVVPTTGPADPATATLVTTLRDNVLPPATAGEDMEAHVGGSTAIMMDLADQVGASLPRFIGGVVILSALLLLLAYRSIVIPVKAAAMNLLSICAAYGVVVMVFQFGWGSHLIGMDELVPIVSYVPTMMFAVLFGLSMDYEVFLLTSFQEHWTRTQDMVVSVRRGLTDTGQVVTSAASIMVVVFASFILVPDATVKMFGVGLATAVFLDATIVRCILVPALMVLAAKVTWWLPKWLDRAMPRLHVEGDPQSLASIHEPPKEYVPDTVEEALKPAIPIFPVLFGVVIGWIIGSRLSPPEPDFPYQDVAIIVSAIVGGLILWVPRAMPGAGRVPGARILSALGGALLVALLYAFMRAVIPFTSQNHGQMAAWAMIVVAALAAFTGMKKYGLPVILGGIVMAVTIAVAGSPTTDLGSYMKAAVIPMFLSGFVTLVIQRMMRIVSPDRPEAAQPEPSGGPDGSWDDGGEPPAQPAPEPDLAGVPR